MVEKNVAAANRSEDILACLAEARRLSRANACLAEARTFRRAKACRAEARRRVGRAKAGAGARHERRIVEIRPFDSAQLDEPRKIPELAAGVNGGWQNSKILREHLDQARRHRLGDHQADHVAKLAPMKPLRNSVRD